MTNRSELTVTAAAKALRVRKRLGVPLSEPVCVLDAAERLGVEVRLVDLPSMEGIYISGPDPKILLSTLRPPGRRNFTCAHELGHHLFDHGEQFDELLSDRTTRRRHDPNELIANAFAAYFLMPKGTLDSGMNKRGFDYSNLTPIQMYALASWLGVGYETLVTHMRYGLNAILHEKTQEFLRFQPRGIRQQILGRSVSTQLHLVDRFWVGRSIDAEVGDYVIAPTATESEGVPLVHDAPVSLGSVFHVVTPGIGRIFNDRLDFSAFVRASKREYVGRCCFRFEEEVN